MQLDVKFNEAVICDLRLFIFIRRATMIGYSGWSHPATSPLKRLCSASLARLRQEPW